MCAKIESSSFDYRRIWHLALSAQVAGLHRAVPSTTLDKACMQLLCIIAKYAKMSTIFCAGKIDVYTIRYRVRFRPGTQTEFVTSLPPAARRKKYVHNSSLDISTKS